MLVWLGLAWVGYFVVHSFLASLRAKRWVAEYHPGAMPYYRVGFNLISAFLLAPIAVLVYADPGPWLWRWTGAGAWVMSSVRLAALVGFAISLRSYDLSVFLGSRQLRTRSRDASDAESLHISNFHRYVRHPWYFLLLVVIWSGDMSANLLLSAVLMTCYLVVGARLEERKLLLVYGVAYAEYCASVAGLLPLPWRVLSRQRAAEIVARSAELATNPVPIAQVPRKV